MNADDLAEKPALPPGPSVLRAAFECFQSSREFVTLLFELLVSCVLSPGFRYHCRTQPRPRARGVLAEIWFVGLLLPSEPGLAQNHPYNVVVPISGIKQTATADT